jgi:3-phosphoshikimate 1-carboxyvinyltransferase
VNAIELEDGFEIHPGEMHSAVFQTYDDHRMAMSFALIGLGSEGIQIADPSCVSKTFPDFFDVLESIRPELP